MFLYISFFTASGKNKKGKKNIYGGKKKKNNADGPQQDSDEEEEAENMESKEVDYMSESSSGNKYSSNNYVDYILLCSKLLFSFLFNASSVVCLVVGILF